MRKRTFAILLALTAVIAFVAILPRTPPGRAWLLGRLTSALERAGITVSYRSSAGDLWAGVRLEGAEVRAAGADLSARTLKIHYFLPSLITGDLPLSVTVDGLRGAVNVGRLPGGGSGGGLPVRPRLQELTVSDVSVSVQQVPYTLPSGAVSHVRIRRQDSALQVDAQLTTADGSADVSGTVDLSAPSFDGRIVRADVRLARHWFRGASGGTVSGPIRAGPGGVRADLTLEGGALDAIGLQPHAIHGSVLLDYPLVRADVRGTVLGGDVGAQGVVNIAARHWTAHAQGDTRLLDTARWLARGSLPPGGGLPLHGTATAALDASGWTHVHVGGNARGSGSFAGLPLSDLQADYSYDTAAGVKVQATGRVAGGAAVVSAVTGPDATTIEATAEQMTPAPGQSVDLRAHLALGSSGPSGTIHAQDSGTFLSRSVSVALDGGVNGDGWQAVIHGHDARGATLEGAVALSGSDLSGEVRVRDLALPAMPEPLTASLRADGKLTALPLTLSLGGGGPVAVGLGSERLDADLAGTATATLEAGRLTGIDASLGPLGLTGDLAFAPLTGRLALTLAPSRVTGPVSTRLALDGGQVAFGNGKATARGTLRVGEIRAGPVSVPALTLDIAPAAGGAGGVALRGRDHGLQIALQGGLAKARFQAFPAQLAGVDARIDGSAGLALQAHPLAGLTSDLSVTAAGATLTAAGSGHALAAELRAPVGTRLGPLTLARPLALAGSLDVTAGSGTLQGSLGDVPLRAALTLSGGVQGSLSAASDAGTLTLEASRGGWRAHGDMRVDALGTALGLPLKGDLTADLRGGPGGYDGSARLDATAPLNARTRVTGTGRTLEATLTSSLLGRPVTVSGTLRPDLALTARAGPLGPVTLRRGRLTGSGSIPAQTLAAGAALAPIDWSVRGTLSPLSIDLDLGANGAARLDAANGARLAAALRLPLRYGGASYTLDVATAGSGPVLAPAGAPAVKLAGGLGELPVAGGLVDASGTRLVSVSGSPNALALRGSLPAAVAGASLPGPLVPAGDVSFTGNARLTGARRMHLDGSWNAGGMALSGAVSSSSAGTSLNLRGAGLSVDVTPGRASVTANGATLAPFFPALPLEPVLDGALSRKQGTYGGAMKVRLRLPASGAGTAVATLTGEGTQLDASLSGAVGPLDVEARGALLPAPRLHADLRGWGGAAVLSADTHGPWGHLTVAGTLATEALGAEPWIRIPAQHLAFQADTSTGALSASGDGVTLTGTLADMQAGLQLPFRLLAGDERLDLRASGPVASPRVDATLTGPVAGTLSGDVREGIHLDAVAASRALSPLLPLGGATLAADVQASADLRPSGAWRAHVRSAVGAAGHRLPVEAALAGAAADYSGTLTLFAGAPRAAGPDRATPGAGGATAASRADARPAAPAAAAADGRGAALVRAAVSGTGTDARATVDLAGVDFAGLGALLGVPLRLDAAGALTLATRPLTAALQIDASGTAAGRPLALSGHARSGDIALDGSYGPLAVHAGRTGGTPLALDVRAAPAEVDLHGSLALSPGTALALHGTAGGMPADVTLHADLAARSGRLRAALGGATLRAELSLAGRVSTLTASAGAPAGALAPIGVPLSGTLALEAGGPPGEVTLQRFALDLSGGPTPLSASLSGPLYPDAKLSGTVSAPAWEASGGLSLTGPPSALDAGLTVDGLRLLAELHGRRLARLTADGSARLAPFGRTTTLEAAGLSWTDASGFAGNGTLTLQDTPAGLPGEVALTLAGAGPLAVTSTLGPPADPWAKLDARLAADPGSPQAWQGDLKLHLPLAALAGIPGPAALTLRGAPALGGSLLHPSLQGSVALTGAAEADGTVAWQGGSGHVTLSSDRLTLRGDLQGGAWHAIARLDRLPLEPFSPALAGAHASLQADLRGGAGTALQGNLSQLELVAPGASLTGTATVQNGLRAALQVSADLSAMHLPGPPLNGLVHGPLVLAAPDLSRLGDGTLIAQLDVAHLGPSGVDAAVDGSFQVGGSVTAPVLSATLQGSGDVHGQLRAGAALRPRRLDLHSTLAYRALSTDLNVSVHDGAVEASGRAAYGDAEIGVSTTADGALALQGANALQGWQASVPPSLATASVSGPLGGLGAGAAGRLSLTLGGRPWLDGAIQTAAVAGISLGDLTLTSDAPGSPVHLDGAHLQAQLDPAKLDWHAGLRGQPLTGALTVTGDASGHAATGKASLQVSGDLAGEPTSVTLQASRGRDLAIDAQGRLLAGTLDAHASRPAGAGWQGSLSLDGAALGGVTATVDGAVGTGAAGGPKVDANVALEGAVSGKARLRASPSAIDVDAALKGDVLGGSVTASGSLAPTLDLTLAAAGADTPDRGELRLYVAGGALRGDGKLQLRAGPTRLSLTGGGAEAPVAVGIGVPAVPGLAFQGPLPTQPPAQLLRTLTHSGLSLAGTDATQGRLTLTATPAPSAELQKVSLRLATLEVSADGRVSAGGARLDGTVALPDGLPVDDLGGTSVPYSLAWQAGTLTVTSQGPTGHIQARLDPASGSGHVSADLHTLGAKPGTASVDVTFDPRAGAGGHVRIDGVTVSRPELPGLTVAADVKLGSGEATGTVTVDSAHGGLHLSGDWGLADLLPAALAPVGRSGGNAELRVSTFALSTLPTLQRVAPHLAGSASGVVRVRGRTVVGQLLVPDLKVADTALPLDAQISGTLGRLDARVKLGTSLATATLEPGSAKGLLRFQSFPAQVLAEATTGSTDIKADVDGVMRFDVPYRDPAAAYLRMATQQVTLERGGVTTKGNLSWVYNDHAVTVTDAAFEGRGSWQAKGTVDASTLNFQLSASNADFTTLLDLVPVFARYGVGASGSFNLDAQGSPADPKVTLDASGLEARVAGTHYRVENARAALQGRALTGSAHVVGVAPLGGSVDVKGSAHLSLAPLSLSNTDFNFSGSAELPVVGTVTDLSGGITQKQGEPPQLALSGKLGNAFTIRGSLTPFDVAVVGKQLDLKARPLFITSSTVDANVRVKGTKAGLTIGGELDASEVHMNIGAPSAPGPSGPGAAQSAGDGGTASQPSSAGAGGNGTQAPPGSNAAGASRQQGGPTAAQAPGPDAPTAASSGTSPDAGQAAHAARESVIFDHLHLKAPQRVLLAAGFGNAEASLDLTLTGTAASPHLDGEASALRGTLTFAGRDFTIDQATASFQASRGVYPTLDVQAHTEFDKQRALGSATDLTFAAPRDSNTFQVTLSFSGQVQPAKQGPSPVTFDIQPTLSSNALVQSTTASGTTSPRPLSDSELLSLVTLGRLGVTPQLAGQSAFGTAVAKSALDTAVDVLVVSELQDALSKALGIDVVQIQTTPLSSLLENSGQPFGVSLRLGGYLTPELFASYRLGNYNGVNGAFGFSNEVSLSYDLGPLNFDLSGRLSFPDSASGQGAVPALGVGLRYAFTSNLGLEAGLDLSDVRRQARFGVSVHW